MNRRLGYPLLWLTAWSVLLAAMLATFNLLAVDETRYAGVAWEMFHAGEFLVPLNNGTPYAQKPPLLFWLLQAGWLAFGVSDGWPRIATGLCSLLSLYLTLRLARRLWPQRDATAYLAPTILLASLLWSVWTPIVMFDVLLAACVLTAITGIVIAACDRAHEGWLLTGLGIALGTLAKGPVILLHTLPVAILAPLWHPRRGSMDWRGWYTGLLAALALGATIALAWAAPAALSGGSRYAQAIFWKQSAGRLVDSFAHRHAFYWYLPWLPLALFPWSLWPPVWRALARLRRGGEWQSRLLLAWLLPTFAGFSLVSGKQIHYLLPLLPAFALLVARGLDSEPSSRRRWRDQWPVGVTMLIVAGILLWVPARSAASQHLPAWVAAVSPVTALLVAGCALITVLPMRSVEGQARLLAGAGIALVAVLLIGIGRPAAPYYDLSGAARVVGSLQARRAPVAHVGKYHNRFQFLGRLTEPVTVIGAEEVLAWAQTHPRGYVVAYFDHRPRLDGGALPHYIQPYRNAWLTIWPCAVLAQRAELIAEMD